MTVCPSTHTAYLELYKGTVADVILYHFTGALQKQGLIWREFMEHNL